MLTFVFWEVIVNLNQIKKIKILTYRRCMEMKKAILINVAKFEALYPQHSSLELCAISPCTKYSLFISHLSKNRGSTYSF